MTIRIHLNPGDRFGRLTIVEEIEPGRKSCGRLKRRFLCVCDCGATKIGSLRDLTYGDLKSCGCLQLETVGRLRRTHGRSSNAGMNASKLYPVWLSMKDRCHNENSRSYKRYGAKGITVCDRWRYSFENFLEDMGEPPPGLTLDRRDGTKGYSPDNCRWATPKEQTLNRSVTRWIEYNGETLCLADWARKIGIDFKTLSGRLKRGWPIEEALTTPPQKTWKKVKRVKPD